MSARYQSFSVSYRNIYKFSYWYIIKLCPSVSSLLLQLTETFLYLDEIKKRRQEISEVLNKPEDARDDDEGEPGNDSVIHGDDEEPDVKQGVDDERNSERGRREVILKGTRRRVVLTSRRESEGRDDEMEETNEEGNLGNEGVEDGEGNLERSKGDEMIVNREEGEVEEEGRKAKTQEEMERDVEVNDTEMKSGGKEMKDNEMETPEISQDQSSKEDVTEDVGINREGEPTKDGGNSESAVTAEEAGNLPKHNDTEVKNMDQGEPAAEEKIKNHPDDDKQTEIDSNMQVDSVQDNNE